MARFASSQPRILGLDSIRFLCALIVVCGHAKLYFLSPGLERPWGLPVGALVQNLFSGPAAVIVFFLVSGFCIHYPFRRGGHQVFGAKYYLRRSLRIGVPLGVALAVNAFFGRNMSTIIWSIICEEVYYLAYPWLRSMREHLGSWKKILWVSALVSFAILLTNPEALHYPAFGWLTPLFALPCWLLGCLLAETFDKEVPKAGERELSIVFYRVALGLGFILCSVLRFHALIGYPWTLNLLAIGTYFWLKREVIRYNLQRHRPWPLLERAGKATYSTYLIHTFLFEFLLVSWGLWQTSESIIAQVINCAMILAGSGIYYFLVEKPSHALTRRLLNPVLPEPADLSRKSA